MSALASKLYRIVRSPVAVIADAGGYTILVIRAPGRLAYRMAMLLLREGIGENIGGHGSLAIIRVKKSIDDRTLLDAIRRASFEAQRRRRRR